MKIFSLVILLSTASAFAQFDEGWSHMDEYAPIEIQEERTEIFDLSILTSVNSQDCNPLDGCSESQAPVQEAGIFDKKIINDVYKAAANCLKSHHNLKLHISEWSLGTIKNANNEEIGKLVMKDNSGATTIHYHVKNNQAEVLQVEGKINNSEFNLADQCSK